MKQIKNKTITFIYFVNLAKPRINERFILNEGLTLPEPRHDGVCHKRWSFDINKNRKLCRFIKRELKVSFF